MATRRERVVLDLQDNFTSGMIRAAGAAALLNKELNSLSGQSVRTSRTTSDVDRPVRNLGNSSRATSNDIDRLSGRLGILVNLAASLGPSLIPIGAVAVPAMSGLAAQFGFAATGAATAILAFQGVGDALKAMNKAQLQPTTENLQAAGLAMEQLSPVARDLVSQLQDMGPAFKSLRDAAASGMFPGVSEGLASMEAVLPRVRGLVSAVASELGEIAGDVGGSLASGRWDDFLDFLGREAPSALADMAQAAGNTAHAVANMWMDLHPLNDDFSKWLVRVSKDLDDWSASLSQTQGFQEFVAYIRDNAPQVGETLVSIGDALVQIVEAAAPLGGPTLHVIEAFADAIAKIADSDLGTPIMAILSLTSAMKLLKSASAGIVGASAAAGASGAGGWLFAPMAMGAERATGQLKGLRSGLLNVTTAQERAQTSAGALTRRQQELRRGLGTSAAVVGGLALATTGLGSSMGITNTASLGLMGTIAGPWGAALGTAAGLVLDVAHANDSMESATRRADAAMSAQSGTMAQRREVLKQLGAEVKESQEDPNFFNVVDNLQRTWALVTGHANDGLNRFRELKKQLDTEMAQAQWDKTAEASQRRWFASQALMRNGLRATSAGLAEAAMSAQQFANSLNRAGTALDRRSGLRSYQEALDAVTQSVKDNGKSLDITTAKGRANQQALDNVAAAALATAKTFQDSGQRTTFLDRARDGMIKAAMQLGLTRAAAKRLADQLGLVDRARPNPVATLRDHVTPQAKHIRDELNSLRGGVNVPVTITIRGRVPTPSELVRNPSLNKAPVTGPSSADGNTVPGQRTPYGDKVLMWVAPGEEVISNRFGQADRHRTLLKAINAGRMESGGTVPTTIGTAVSWAGPDPRPYVAFTQAVNAATTSVKSSLTPRQQLMERIKTLSGGIDKTASSLANLRQVQSSLADTIRSKWDLSSVFDSGFGFGSTTTGPNGEQVALPPEVQADLNAMARNTAIKNMGIQASAFSAAMGTLKAKGLNGAMFTDLAASGNDTLAAQYASMSRGQLNTLEAQYNRSQRQINQAGSSIAQAAYGTQIARQTKVLAEQRDAIRGLRTELAALRADKDGPTKREDQAERNGKHLADAITKVVVAGNRDRRGH